MTKKNPLAVILGLSAVFFVIFIAVAVCVVMNLSMGKTKKNIFGRANNIGILELKGMISDSRKLLEQISEFDEDPLIRGVVLRINSPGGAVAPSQEIYESVKRLSKTKPVYASMSSLAASGGYYVACGAKKIFANPGTLTGSIGVIMQFADLSKLFQWVKVNPYNIKTGKFKDIGSPNREMTADERALLQSMIDNVLSQFRRAVAASRNLPMEKVIEVSDGRIFSGEQAKEAKLVDELGGIEEAITAVAKEAGIVGKPNVVYPSKKHGLLDRLFGGLDDESESSTAAPGLRGALKLFARILGYEDALEGSIASPGAGFAGPLFLMTGR